MTRRERTIGIAKCIAAEMALLAAIGAGFAAAGLALTIVANGLRWGELLNGMRRG